MLFKVSCIDVYWPKIINTLYYQNDLIELF